MKTITVMVAILALACLLVGVVACSTEGIERAEAQKWDAKARAEAAPIAAQAVVIDAQTNAALEKLRALTDIGKEVRAFDAQMARQEFAATVLEMQALNLAIRQETEAASEAAEKLEKAAESAGPIGHNAFAAARNAWYTNWLLGIFGGLLFGFGAIVVIFAARFERRLAELGGR